MAYLIMFKPKGSQKWQLYSSIARTDKKQAKRVKDREAAKNPTHYFEIMKMDMRKQSAKQDFPNVEVI